MTAKSANVGLSTVIILSTALLSSTTQISKKKSWPVAPLVMKVPIFHSSWIEMASGNWLLPMTCVTPTILVAGGLTSIRCPSIRNKRTLITTDDLKKLAQSQGVRGFEEDIQKIQAAVPAGQKSRKNAALEKITSTKSRKQWKPSESYAFCKLHCDGRHGKKKASCVQLAPVKKRI